MIERGTIHSDNAADGYLPFPPPDPSEGDWKEFERSGDFIPLFFEWYKFVGALVNALSFVEPQSQDFKEISEHSYYVLSGLLHRCARLMLANVALSHEGKFGETASIVDRCLCETAVKVVWLCANETESRVTRYMATSLKPECEFEDHILENISRRGGEALPLEKRMLGSIDRHFEAAGLTREDALRAKKLPDVATMIQSSGHDRLDYIVLQRLGSHHIHGTWPSLLMHYLDPSDNEQYAFVPRGRPVAMHINQYLQGCRFVLHAAVAYSRRCLVGASQEAFASLAEETLDQIIDHYAEATRRREK